MATEFNKIIFEDKVTLNPRSGIAEINKITADNMNEIKNVINGNADVITIELNHIKNEIDNKLTIPTGETVQVLNGQGTPITPTATPTNGSTLPFTSGGAYTEFNQVNASLTDIVKPLDWLTLTLFQGFTHVENNPVQCAKDGLGMVHFRGAMKAPDTPLGGNYILSMPGIYRPSISQYRPVPAYNGVQFLSLAYATISHGDSYMYMYPTSIEPSHVFWVGAIAPYKASN